MPSKTKLKNAAIAARSAALPSIPNELIDQFVTGPMSAEAVNAASVAFKKALIERALGAELGHLGAQLLGAHGRADVRTGEVSQLHGGDAHPAGGTVDKDAFAAAKSSLGEESVVGSGEHLGKAAGLDPVHGVGDGHQKAFVDGG